MEHLLQCYLTQFASSPRNSLHDRRKRRSAVDYISTLIEGCIRGQNADPQVVCREAITTIIRYHADNRSSNGSICMMGKFHNILYVAVRLCFDWQLKDTSTVVALLEHIYACEKTFERIFIGAIFGNMASHYIAGWKSDFDSQEENLKAVVYFIEHATVAGLEVEEVRFIDVPIETCGKASSLTIAIQLGLPDKLHSFLRYGALIGEHTIELLLKRLMEFCHVYPHNIMACLQLILRAIPTIDLPRQTIMENYYSLVEDSLIPLTRCGVEPPELKHLARCSIRRRLWENHQLPHGIRSLTIPQSLKGYLDIMED